MSKARRDSDLSDPRIEHMRKHLARLGREVEGWFLRRARRPARAWTTCETRDCAHEAAAKTDDRGVPA